MNSTKESPVNMNPPQVVAPSDIQILQPPGWAAPRGYSNGIAARGRTVVIGGQVGWDGQCRFHTGDFVWPGQAGAAKHR